MKHLITLIVLVLLPLSAHAQITPAQATTLKTMILANQTAAGYFAIGDDTSLKDWLNAPGTKIVWRTLIYKHEITSLPSPTGTFFDWASAGGYIARSQAERDAFKEVWNSSGSINPSLANVQAAMADIFSGSGAGAVGNRAHFLAVSKRSASRAEGALATGTGTTATPGFLVWEGSIDYDDTSLIHAQ